jgi:hypothetical protein
VARINFARQCGHEQGLELVEHGAAPGRQLPHGHEVEHAVGPGHAVDAVLRERLAVFGVLREPVTLARSHLRHGDRAQRLELGGQRFLAQVFVAGQAFGDDARGVDRRALLRGRSRRAGDQQHEPEARDHHQRDCDEPGHGGPDIVSEGDVPGGSRAAPRAAPARRPRGAREAAVALAGRHAGSAHVVLFVGLVGAAHAH